MSILDQLVEKKDIGAYADFRMGHLKRQMELAIESLPPEKREAVRVKIRGRIDELRLLKKIACNNNFKKMSKQYSDEAQHIETRSGPQIDDCVSHTGLCLRVVRR